MRNASLLQTGSLPESEILALPGCARSVLPSAAGPVSSECLHAVARIGD